VDLLGINIESEDGVALWPVVARILRQISMLKDIQKDDGMLGVGVLLSLRLNLLLLLLLLLTIHSLCCFIYSSFFCAFIHFCCPSANG
jgi:hypothetical protein